MALPVILIDSATGSDTQASGAGPGTALFGTTDASTDAAGTTVTLTAGTDLSGVATDGSHVIYLADATAGARNFGKITGSAGSGGATPTVTVANAFGLNLVNKSWAIGGKRASIGSTTTKKLFDNNSAAGDAMPGWVVEMQSGHSETIAATFTWQRDGDTTTGAIMLRGISGAATLPLITFSNNGNAFGLGNRQVCVLRDFEMQNSNATKTASVAFSGTLLADVVLRGLKISHSTNKFWRVRSGASDYSMRIQECEFGYLANSAIHATLFNTLTLINNYIHDCGATAVFLPGGNYIVAGNIIANNAGDGINTTPSTVGTLGGLSLPLTVIGNTFDNNTGDGLEVTNAFAANQGTFDSMTILNNIFSNNGAYGLKFSGAGVTDALLAQIGTRVLGNTFYNNTSGAHSPTLTLTSENEQTSNPTYTNAASGDYSIGTNLKAKGYPVGGSLYVGKTSTTYSYVDPGAAQRQEAGGGGTTIKNYGPVWIG